MNIASICLLISSCLLELKPGRCVFPGTPVIQVQPYQTFEGSSCNQFVLQSSNYPDEQPGTGFNCSIDLPENMTVSATVGDLYPAYDNGGACLKISLSASPCVKSGQLSTIISDGPIYMHTKISQRFFLVIQAEPGVSNQRPANLDFEITCINAPMTGTVQDSTQTENDNGKPTTTKSNDISTMPPAPAEYSTTTKDDDHTMAPIPAEYSTTTRGTGPKLRSGNLLLVAAVAVGCFTFGVLGSSGIAVFIFRKRYKKERNNSDYKKIPTQPEAIGSTSTEATGYTNIILPDKQGSDLYEYPSSNSTTSDGWDEYF